MSVLFSDTSPSAEQIQLELLRRAPAWRKLHMVAQMNLTVRRLALSGLRQRYPWLAKLSCTAAWLTCCWGPNWRPRFTGRSRTCTLINEPVAVTLLVIVDVFVAGSKAFAHQQPARRSAQVVADDPERTAYVLSAEDILLAKLDWHRQGGEVSERQWRDVLGVLRAQAGRLDQVYLRQWAARLSVSDLLERALSEVA
jgi:hypothetical protein